MFLLSSPTTQVFLKGFYFFSLTSKEIGKRDYLGITVDCVPRLRVSLKNTLLDQPENLIRESASSVEVGNVNVQM